MRARLGRGMGCAVLAAFVGGLVPGQGHAQRPAYEELQTFTGVLNHVRVNYVDSVDYSVLVRAGIEGVLNALDPHSYFVSREDWEAEQALENGQKASVGLSLIDEDGAVTVLGVAPGSPADRGGIASGDRVLAVDDTPVAGLRATHVEETLIGDKGSRLTLTLERGPRLAADTFTVGLRREPFDRRVVGLARMLDDETGYVRLDEFMGDAAEQTEDALRNLQRQGARRFVLDLRHNPGGALDQAVNVASLFLPKNTLVFSTKGRRAAADEEYRTKKDGRFREAPLIVLIDDGSASASEAVAGSLQDHDRALIVGRRSFGKALVQAPFQLPHGDVVWLTIARVVTPSGRIIQRSYAGLNSWQYRAFAGTARGSKDDSTYTTDGGRPVHGGGGIAPDVVLGAAPVPAWVAAAYADGLMTALADSVAAAGAAAGPEAWLASRGQWPELLGKPFVERAAARYHVALDPDPDLLARLGTFVARRVAEVAWGADARDMITVSTDPVIQDAVSHFPELDQRLRTAAGKTR